MIMMPTTNKSNTIKPMIIIVSGRAGAGKSTALHVLEDIGFFCTDNLPIEMLAQWNATVTAYHPLAAVCLDVRSFQASEDDVLRLPNIDAQWLTMYIEADDETLQRRFSLLRRKHPFGSSSSPIALHEAIAKEHDAMQLIRQRADVVFDSSSLNTYELANLIETFWLEQQNNDKYRCAPICTLYSFSYRGGLPKSSDMVLDARHLPNPHYIPHLAPLTGRDQAVRYFFSQYSEVAESINYSTEWLSFIWPRLRLEHKQYFTLSIGCSGGRHRSVYWVESIAQWMKDEKMCVPLVIHRELHDAR